jgi:HicB_like antitoxin of bacterial toxin-antitoxin system
MGREACGACESRISRAASAGAQPRKRRSPTPPRRFGTSPRTSGRAGFDKSRASTLTEIVASGEIGEGESAVMVPLLIDSGRTVRANVSFDAALLDAIDAAAKERGLTRSAFLASAARGKIMAGA